MPRSSSSDRVQGVIMMLSVFMRLVVLVLLFRAGVEQNPGPGAIPDIADLVKVPAQVCLSRSRSYLPLV